MLQCEPDFKKLIIDPPLFTYESSKILNELLRTRRPHTGVETYKGTIPCLNCGNCNNIVKGNVVNHPTKGNKIRLFTTATCDSMNLVYMLKCPCGQAYIGKTERKIKTRINEHKSNIRNKNTKSIVATHFMAHNHNISQLRFLVLEVVEMREGRDNHKIPHTAWNLLD